MATRATLFIVSFLVTALCFSQSVLARGGGGKPTCNKRALATAYPPKITSLVATSSMRINVKSDFGFYDGSTLDYIAIRIFDESDTLLSSFPDMIYTGSTNNLRDMSIEGLQPGRTYKVQVIDSTPRGACVAAQAAIPITMPVLVPESVVPVVSAPYVQGYYAYIGSFYVIQGLMNDDTGVAGVQVSINGKVVAAWSKDITQSGWFVHWNENVVKPDTKYDLGHIYEVSIPNELHGTTALVEVRVTDPFGNVTLKSANLFLP